MTIEEELLKELKKISKMMILANDSQLEVALAKYATNDDRRKIWVLINGERQPDDIVKISGLKKSAVYGFLKTLENSELIERQHGKPPKKILDYVPADWANLVQNTAVQTGKEEQQVVSEQQPEIQNGGEKLL